MKKMHSIHRYNKVKGLCLVLAVMLLIGMLSEVADAEGDVDVQASTQAGEILDAGTENETEEISAEAMEEEPSAEPEEEEDTDSDADYYAFFQGAAARATHVIPAGAATAAIQSTINSADDGDTIQFSGDITLSRALTISKTLTFAAVSGDVTITSPASALDNTGRHMIITGDNVTLTFDGVVLQGSDSYLHVGDIDGSNASRSFAAGGIDSSAGTLTLVNAKIIGCHSYRTSDYEGISGQFAEGAGIHATGNLILRGCTVADNMMVIDIVNEAGGAGLSVCGSGLELTVADSAITGNSVVTRPSGWLAGYGGGIYFKSGNGSVQVTGSEIRSNKSATGGGIAVISDGSSSLTITGAARLSDNSARRGGGVYTEGTKVYLNGNAVIEKCRATNESDSGIGGGTGVGGGLYIMGYEDFEMENAVVAYNYAALQGGGIQFIVPTGSAGKDNGTFSMGTDAKLIGNVAHLNRLENYEYGGVGGGCFISSGRTFIMSDNAEIDGTQSEYPHNAGSTGGGVTVVGKFIMKDSAIIQNCTSAIDAGGVDVLAGGEFYMDSSEAKIVRCSAEGSGGGVSCDRSAFYLSAGTIGGSESDANSAIQGAGVYLSAQIGGTTTFEMSGGEVSYNKAGEDGGGIYMRSTATVNSKITGGDIYGNTAGAAGGGIYMMAVGSAGILQLAMTDGNIYGNISGTTGGGIYMETGSVNGSTQLTMTGGTIGKPGAPNTAETGGGIYTIRNSAVDMSGSAAITYNEAKTHGGAVYLYGGTFDMQGGTIGHNTASDGDGGGFYVAAGAARLTISGGSISSNIAAGDGGGIYTAAAGAGPGAYNNLTVGAAVTFSDNHAARSYDPLDGDGIYSSYWTGINNQTYSSPLSPTVVSRLAVVNNLDINAQLVKVTFVAGGGVYKVNGASESSAGIPPQTHVPGAKVIDPETGGTLSLAEHTLEGWYTDDGTFAHQWDFASDTLSEDITLYAKWEPWGGMDFTFTKTDETVTAGLEGAAFTLYKWVGGDAPTASTMAAEDSLSWEKVDDQISGATGLTTFEGLLSGIYQLVEDEAPFGYAVPKNQWRFEVTVNTEENTYEISEGITIVQVDESWSVDFVEGLAVPDSPELALPNRRAFTFAFTKVKAEDIEQPLSGAVFQLYLWTGAGTAPELAENSTVNNGTTITDQWELVYTRSSGEDGAVVFDGLADGVYQLAESKAPAGYDKPVGQWRLIPDPSGGWQITAKGSMPPPAFLKEAGQLAVPNMKGKFFPLSGFGGIVKYLLIGLGVIVLSVVFFLFSRKRKININELIYTKGGEGGKM